MFRPDMTLRGWLGVKTSSIYPPSLLQEGLEERKSKNRGLKPKRNALMMAVRNQDVKKVERLLNQGIDPNFRDADGDFLLHVACAAEVDGQSSGEQGRLSLFLSRE